LCAVQHGLQRRLTDDLEKVFLKPFFLFPPYSNMTAVPVPAVSSYELLTAFPTLTPSELCAKHREQRQKNLRLFPLPPVEDVYQVQDSVFKGPETNIPLRIYTPEGQLNDMGYRH
jgi:hypothetical protein